MKLSPLECRIVEGLRRAVLEHEMLPAGARVLVACSGGPDSVGLLHLLRIHGERIAEGSSLAVAHLDHGLRGVEGAEDRSFVAALARRHELPLWEDRIEVGEAAEEEGLSIEDAARRARYAFLRDGARELGCDRIATAHTMDDAAETLLLRLLRGAGRTGLSGLRPVRGEIVRPLIRVGRAELLRWLEERRFPFRHDPSNDDLRFDRNRLRHSVLPVLEREFGPGVLQRIARASWLLAGEDALLERYAADEARSLVRKQGGTLLLHLPSLERVPEAVRRRVVRGWLRETRGSLRGLGAAHYESAASGCDLPGGCRTVIEGEWLRLLSRDGSGAETFLYRLPLPGRVSVGEAGVEVVASLETTVPACGDLRSIPPSRAVLDADRLGRDLVVRSRRPGDRMRPLGMKGRSRKLQDLLVDRKMPRSERERLPLVVACGEGEGSREEVAWVPGVAVAESFKVDEQTRSVAVLEVRPAFPR
jgi:tRNA(Ile)-lysidine synthase